MSFQYLTNTPLEKAQEEYRRFLENAGLMPQAETIPVCAAYGRVTAEAVYAHICAPHYLACAMDGIALAARDTFGAGETTPARLPGDKKTVVDTGDPLPLGCDCVIMMEDVVFNGDGSATLYAPAVPWQHVRQIGEDICAGEMILPAYEAVGPAAVGAMIAAGVTRVRVLKKPVVGIIPTGDEIVPPTADPGEGDILEFNSSIFSAMIAEWGGDAKVYPIVPDRHSAISDAVGTAASECDIVLLNAGSSAGREDYSAQVLEEKGEVLFHGIAMKPGKPAILGRIGAKPAIGVPGYPVSGIIVIEKFLKPIIDSLLCRFVREGARIEATLSHTVVSGLKYREFVRVRLGYVGEKFVASPLNRGAGVVSSFMKADGMLEIPQGVEGYETGTRVAVRLLRPEEELKNTLVVIGSHDPLLDELANLLHIHDRLLHMSSTHVGSMGGILAIRRKEAHAAGIHLLDESDGSYNVSYIEKYFPEGGVRLIECVGRTQGLMIPRGNPLDLRAFANLDKPGLRYVNRQKGSGTRLLFDYLCRVNGIRAAGIDGYDREEYTHTAVAAQIASGSCDAGMGIWSAAKLYDLDFLPLCSERYDLLISDDEWETQRVQALIETMGSGEFRARLGELGGYTFDSPGRVIKHFSGSDATDG